MSQRAPGLYYAPSDVHGRGVFCAHALSPGDVIEISPVIVLDGSEIDLLSRSHLYEYYFLWGRDHDACAIALGYGSMYNHSEEPNAEFVPDYSDDTIIFTALKEIQPGEEITIDYQEGAAVRALWF